MDRAISEDVLAEILAAFVASGLRPSDAAIHQWAYATGRSEESKRQELGSRKPPHPAALWTHALMLCLIGRLSTSE